MGEVYFTIIVALLFGLLIGSFLNVVIYRLPVMLNRDWTEAACEQLNINDEFWQKQPASVAQGLREHFGLNRAVSGTFNLMTPPSRCGNCGSAVRPWQNIPVLSWLMLRGKCAGCHTPISIRYPLVELLTGVLFAVMAFKYGWTWYTVGACLFTAYVVAMTFIDADTQLLPDDLTIPLMRWGLLFNLLTSFIPLTQSVWGMLIGYMSLWTLSQTYKLIRGVDGMGAGDFKMLAAIGAWLGAWILPVVIFAAAMVFLVVAIIRGIGKEQPMAYGPCLGVAGWLVFLFYDVVMRGVTAWLTGSGF